jgi:hypothetical protein
VNKKAKWKIKILEEDKFKYINKTEWDKYIYY